MDQVEALYQYNCEQYLIFLPESTDLTSSNKFHQKDVSLPLYLYDDKRFLYPSFANKQSKTNLIATQVDLDLTLTLFLKMVNQRLQEITDLPTRLNERLYLQKILE